MNVYPFPAASSPQSSPSDGHAMGRGRFHPSTAASSPGEGRLLQLLGPAETGTEATGLLQRLARREPEIFVHGRSVGRLAERIALALGLPPSQASRIRLAGVLHDIGKLAVPADLLRKPGALEEHERRLIERHSSVGASMAHLAGLERESRWIRHHHERIDGGGYPDGLEGEQIPLPSRIILVADAFDALTHPRPYRHALAPGAALAELAAHAGRQFDQDCVETLAGLLAIDPVT